MPPAYGLMRTGGRGRHSFPLGEADRVELAQLPIVQGGAVVVLFAVLWLVYTGRLVPRSTVEDVRADRDARCAEAAGDADEWRKLWQAEREAHELTRRAQTEELKAVLMAATEGTQVAAALLQEIKSRQPGARR